MDSEQKISLHDDSNQAKEDCKLQIEPDEASATQKAIPESSVGPQVNVSTESLVSKFIALDLTGSLVEDRQSMSVDELQAVLAELSQIEQVKSRALTRALTNRKEQMITVASNSNMLCQLEQKKREAVAIYRPIKREYVSDYRQTCIKNRVHLSRLGDDVDFLMKTFGVTMVKVHHTIKKDEPKV